MRIKGWMGRADQTTKIKGMFVRPEQIAGIGKRHPELGRLRLVVSRAGEVDVMTLKAETTGWTTACGRRYPPHCAPSRSSAASPILSFQACFETMAGSSRM